MAGPQADLREVFCQALEYETPQEQADYLDQACQGRPDLRARVEALLRANDEASGFLREPAARQDATMDEPIREQPGTVIGRYKLMEQIGEGGMGLVFVAEQQEPIHRKVALKVIKPGMDTRQVIARFEAERQALALLDHPNIAKVLDGGTTGAEPDASASGPASLAYASGSTGRPYFVMELVKGVPITEYCDQNQVPVRERLELFLDVCQAVQHAHQKGIIHRDIKPSNVLVMSHDGTPVVKVIDFGVAKAIGQQLTDKTIYTQFTQLIGTPLYMSPEQAGQSGLDVDTRSDIYSLGVLLYELLTGTTTFDKDRLKDASYDEIRRIIREEEPPKPSTRISTLGMAATTASANRKSDPKQLSRLFRGELDWIVMKALEKDRNRRYETANGFAMDVQRYLADEPVLAGPPGAGYRLRKFVKRHRGPVLAAAAVLLALVAGIGGTTSGLVEAWRQQDLKEQARKDAETNEQTAKAEERKAKAEWDRAEKQLLRAEWLLYASRISLAQQAWESNDGALAYHYLESCRRDFRGWEHDYLYTHFNRNQQTFRGHQGWIQCVAVSPDDKRIVSGDWDNTVKVWDAATGRETLSMIGHKDLINSVAVSLDGKRIVSGSADKTVKVWDAATGTVILTLTGHTNGIASVAVSADGKRIASGGYDKTVKVWDAATGQEILTIKGHSEPVSSVAFSSDGKRILTGSFDKTARFWDAATGQGGPILKGHLEEITSVAFSAKDARVISGSKDKTVKLWDPATGQVVLNLQGHLDQVSSVAVSRDGTHIVSGGHDRTVKVWDAVTGREVLTLKGHTKLISSVALTSDGKHIVSGGQDRTVKVWETTTSQETVTLKGHQFPVTSVAVSRDGRHIVSGGWDNTVKVWDSATGKEILSVMGQAFMVMGTCVAVSPDGKRIVSGRFDGTIKILDATTGREITTLSGHGLSVSSVALSPDGKRIVSGSGDNTVKVWDMDAGKELLTVQGGTIHGIPYTGVAFSPDGKRVISGYDAQVKVWDAATGQETQCFKGHQNLITGVAVSSDGKRIVSSSLDKTVRVWDTATGQEILTLNGHTGPVMSVALLSKEPKRIVSGSTDNTVKIWDAGSGQETLTLKGHSAVVSSVAVSHDGKRIITGSADGTLKVWDASMSQQDLDSGLGILDVDLPVPKR
jgi:WD40 repeat protein/serine/threonine protein kinase